MDFESQKTRLILAIAKDPRCFVSCLRSDDFDLPIIWQSIVEVVQMALNGGDVSIETLRALYDARLVETVSRILVKNRTIVMLDTGVRLIPSHPRSLTPSDTREAYLERPKS